LLPCLTPQERAELDRLLLTDKKWRPLPGPQTLAYQSKADYLFYGGAAGGGKTDLLLGLAGIEHRRSLILRREMKQLLALEERSKAIYGIRYGMEAYHGTNKIWNFRDGKVRRTIQLAGVENVKDVLNFQGHPDDLKGFDEVTHFTEYMFRFICGWLRTTHQGQRTRVVAAGNPPTDSEGDWVITFWAPWLDPQHPRPAQPGELRYFIVGADGRDVEVDDPQPVLVKGELVKPTSRTFIPAFLSDNPYQDTADYRAILDSLPEPLRSKLKKGDFTAGREDNAWQIIPTEWVLQAQERWKQQKKPTAPLTKVGVDVARGGDDQTVITPRYGAFFDKQTVKPGESTPNGGSVVALALQVRGSSKCTVNVDGIGVGTSVVDLLHNLKVPVTSMIGSEHSDATDRTGTLSFANKRAEWWWKMREALDPQLGDFLALPPDRELLADLCAPRYKVTAQGILVEKKEDVVKRIGRSPDKGDSAVYALANEIPSARTAFGAI
jgi:hypothetical protein